MAESKVARFLFATLPFSGCLHPHLAVACALAGRGHDVAFYTSGRARRRVEDRGFTYFPFAPTIDILLDDATTSAESVGRTWTRPWRLQTGLRGFFVETMAQQHADLTQILDLWAADAIVCDPAIWTPFVILYETRRLPVALVSYVIGSTLPGPDTPPIGLGLPPPRDWSTRLLSTLGHKLIDWIMADLRRQVSKLRRAHGLTPLDGPIMGLAARLPLYLVSSCPELDFERQDLPPNTFYVGPLRWYPPMPPPDWLDEVPTDRLWIHATEGTVHVQEPRVLRASALGLADAPYEVIMTSGPNRAPASLDLGPLGTNVHLVDWVNHGELLPRTDLLICTGNSGTMLAALYHGVPIIAVPTEWDHADNARRVARAGACLILTPRRCTPHRLRQAVEHVLSTPSYRENAARLAACLRRQGGAERAAELLIGMLRMEQED